MLAFDKDHPQYDSMRFLVREHFPLEANEVSLDVDAHDDMFAFRPDVWVSPELCTMSYFRSGLQIWDAVEQCAAMHFGSLRKVRTMCDFASGYGRSTRFLSAVLLPEQIWVGEVQHDAVDFQCRTFGVHGLYSYTDPADLHTDQRFDLIFVSSLFSHLPERTFGPWMARLFDLLEPSGLLVISTQSEDVLPEVCGPMPSSGHFFIADSEVAELDTADYGVAFVTEDFVARTIAAFLPTTDYLRFPRALCFHQDLYLIANAPAPVPTGTFLEGPHGCTEPIQLDQQGNLSVDGWALDHDSKQPVDVFVTVDGTEVARVQPSIERPDVMDAVGFTRHDKRLDCGFEVRAHLGPKVAVHGKVLAVTARSRETRREFVLNIMPVPLLCGPITTPVSTQLRSQADRFDRLYSVWRRRGTAALGEHFVKSAQARVRSRNGRR